MPEQKRITSTHTGSHRKHNAIANIARRDGAGSCLVEGGRAETEPYLSSGRRVHYPAPRAGGEEARRAVGAKWQPRLGKGRRRPGPSRPVPGGGGDLRAGGSI